MTQLFVSALLPCCVFLLHTCKRNLAFNFKLSHCLVRKQNWRGWRGDVGRRFPRFTASLGQVTSQHIFLQSLQGPGPLTQSTRQYFILMEYLQLLASFVHVCLPCCLYPNCQQQKGIVAFIQRIVHSVLISQVLQYLCQTNESSVSF